MILHKKEVKWYTYASQKLISTIELSIKNIKTFSDTLFASNLILFCQSLYPISFQLLKMCWNFMTPIYWLSWRDKCITSLYKSIYSVAVGCMFYKTQSQRNENIPDTKVYAQKFLAALFIIAKRWKQPKFLPSDD